MDIETYNKDVTCVNSTFSRIIILANKSLLINLLADLLKEKSNLTCQVVEVDKLSSDDLFLG